MIQLTAFIKKEIMELVRGGKFLILLLLFLLVGIMNPAIAKLTPWIMETMSEQMADSGLVTTEVTVDAMTSWTQYYKNIPMALIVFLIMMGGCFTAEYQRGTLVNMVTKGLSRWKILAAKTLVIVGMWTLGYWLCFGVTYGYNAYFWDNSIAEELMFSAVIYWLGGVWLCTVIPLASALGDSSAPVLLMTGGAYMVPTLLGVFPKLKKYMPTHLLDSMDLLRRMAVPEDYGWALAVAGCLILGNIALGVVLFDRRSILRMRL